MKPVLYVGNYLDDDIVKTRRMPARNPAGSNRMLRLARAMKAGGIPVSILAPGAMISMGFGASLLHRTELKIVEGISVQYVPALAFPIGGALSELFILPYEVWRRTFTGQVDCVILYCYYPSLILCALAARSNDCRVVEDLEDVCEIRFSDLTREGFAFAFRQLWGTVCLSAIRTLSATFVVPSRTFLKALPLGASFEIVTGCCEKRDDENVLPSDFKDVRLKILYAGKLESEHGAHLFVETLKIIDQDPAFASKLSIEICGYGPASEALKSTTSQLKNLKANFRGFLSGHEFHSLLSGVDIALALQNPDGRFATGKTPSKVYEYLAEGKVVVCTPLPDFLALPSGVCTVLEEYTSEALSKIIRELTPSRVASLKIAAAEYAKANWSYQVVGSRLRKYCKHTKPPVL
jgi:glycosyltransferase involved in cell wall biosynthesis